MAVERSIGSSPAGALVPLLLQSCDVVMSPLGLAVAPSLVVSCLAGRQLPEHQGAARPNVPDGGPDDQGQDARGDPENIQHQGRWLACS